MWMPDKTRLPAFARHLGTGLPGARGLRAPRPLVWSLLAGGLVLAMGTPADAKFRQCKVAGDDGTLQPVFTGPQGKQRGRLPAGTAVKVEGEANDRRGGPWVYVSASTTGKPFGWVAQDAISCK